MTSYSDVLRNSAALPPSPDNALGAWGVGATTRTLKAKTQERLSIKDFGTAGDGTTDDTAAFLAMRDYCRGDWNRHHIIDFPFGTYLYSNNRWLSRIGSIHLVGNGSSLKCTSSSTATGENSAMVPYTMWRSWGDDSSGVGMGTDTTTYPGVLFETVTVGSRVVVLVDPADASYLSAGNRVFLHGYDQQFEGFPPNLRYFEFNEVVSVVSDQVTLLRPIRNSYDQEWKASATVGQEGIGAPHILNLDRGTDYTLNGYVHIQDFVFLANDNTANTNSAWMTGSTVIFDNVTHDDHSTKSEFWPTETELLIVRNCKLNDVEIDKNCDSIYFDRCHINYTLAAATGVNFLSVKDCTIAAAPSQPPCNLSPRVCEISNNTMLLPADQTFGAISTFAVPHFTRKMIVKDNIIVHDGDLQHIVNNQPRLTAFSPAAIATGNHIQLTDNPTTEALLQRIDIGQRLFRVGTTESQFIQRIYHNGTAYIIEAPWNTTITTGDSFDATPIGCLDVSGNVLRGPGGLTLGGARVPIRYIRAHELPGGAEGQIVVARIDDNWMATAAATTHDINAYVQRITARVARPYTGATANPTLTLTLNGLDISSTNYIVIPLDDLGFAETTQYGTNVEAPATATILPKNTAARDFTVTYTSMAGTPAVMPRVAIEIEMMPLG